MVVVGLELTTFWSSYLTTNPGTLTVFHMASRCNLTEVTLTTELPFALFASTGQFGISDEPSGTSLDCCEETHSDMGGTLHRKYL